MYGYICDKPSPRPRAPAALARTCVGVGEGSLGIFTKSHVKLNSQGLQRFHEYLLQDQSAKLLPKERVCNCLKKRIDKYKNREIKYNESRQKAHWANVQRCGSIWTCPVCAKQITEKRREELKTGLTTWKNAHSGGVLLLTLTFSHSAKQPLKSLLEGQKRAYKRFCENTRVVNLLKRIGVRHKIKGFEVTYGANGWHPHNHILLLTEHNVLNFGIYQEELAQIWISCCTRSGLNAPSMQHGLDIRDGSYAEQYVSKWGLEHELTKGHVKQGRNGSFTPFDLLNYSMVDGEMNGRTAASLFQEYAIATKGARQLVWSRGLKALLGIAEKTDEELAEETENEAITLREVDNYIFSLLCNYQLRHEFLLCLERDYENGCFGCGEAEQLLIDILEKEMERLKLSA